MHTVIVVAGGFALLGLCLLVGRWVGGPPPGALPSAALVFILIWLIAAGINMWVGVSRAGYSIADEAPIFVVIFAVPAALAGYLWWTFSRG